MVGHLKPYYTRTRLVKRGPHPEARLLKGTDTASVLRPPSSPCAFTLAAALLRGGRNNPLRTVKVEPCAGVRGENGLRYIKYKAEQLTNYSTYLKSVSYAEAGYILVNQGACYYSLATPGCVHHITRCNLQPAARPGSRSSGVT